MLSPLKSANRTLCPFCFEYFQLRETPFRCTSPMARCEPEPDPILERHWGDNRRLGKVLPPAWRFVRGIKCGSCGKVSRRRLCPHCHADLPHTTGSYKNVIFAIIGAKEAGKSHYLATLIDQLRVNGGALNLLLEAMNDETIARYRQDFYDPVYREHRPISATASALADRRVQRPLVYSLTRVGTGLGGRSVIRGAVVLVFFDTAGEDLDSEDTLSAVNKYIYRSDGLVLLVDPLQLPSVRDQLGSGAGLPNMNTETSDIVTRVTRLVQKGRGLGETDRIPIPLAVAFSKFDAVKPLVDAQFQLHNVARHDGGFDRHDFEAINSEMMALLDEWGGQDLVHQVKIRYAKHGFFGVSALGCNPHTTGRISHVVPQRVEDPFLWLLAENGLLGRAKQ
jgi:hypothetical protein